MDTINNRIRDAIKPYGYKSKTVSIAHLPEVQEAVGILVRQGLVNRRLSENWHFYRTPNTELPEAKTIIITALPQSITRLTFSWQGRDYSGELAPAEYSQADESRVEEILKKVLGNAGYKITKARLPLKTLAVRSGLARYGRNNIAYVPGMGSYCSLIAFYTDMPCDGDSWQEPAAMPTCKNCALCRETCVNGCFTTDRFLVHAEHCLGFLYSIEPGVPHHVQKQPGWLNALFGCMCCQSVCPVNKPYLKNIKAGPSFSEEETAAILNKTPWEKLSSENQKKLEPVRNFYPPIACNLLALIEKQRLA